MKKNMIFFACSLMVFSTLYSCAGAKSDGSGGSASLIPSSTAIVKATLPAQLESSSVSGLSVHTRTTDSNLQTLKDRIFSPGPVDFLFRLSKVDERLAEISACVEACASNPTTTYTPPSIATGFSFPMEFSCKVTIDASALGVSDYQVYFGKSGGYWYVADIQTNSAFESGDGEPPTLAVLSKIDEAGNTAEIYQISAEKVSGTYYSTIMHIKADKNTGEFEVSTASSAENNTQTISPGANYSGVGCGVMMKTNGTLVYATGKFDQLTSCPSTANVCADSALEDTTGCTGVVDSFSVLDLTDRTVINANNAKSLIVDRTWLNGL